MKGLSQAALAREVGISSAAVHQFESGLTQPSSPTLERLSVLLSVAPTFFYRGEVAANGRPFFRSLTRVPAGERERAHGYALAIADVVMELDELLELPRPAISRIASTDETTAPERIEQAAAAARQKWNVPSGPVADMVAVAESRGAVVAAVGEFHSGIDAFSLPTSPRPVVVLCSDKGVATRRRFDVAHELGHLALHEPLGEVSRWQEQQAHRFASAFLMPADEISEFLPSRGDDLRGFERLARTWGVSMQAAMMRAKHLGKINDTEHGRGMRRLSRAGWRTKEPVEVGPPERPRLLLAAAQALDDAGADLQVLAEKLGMPIGRLRRMMSLPEAHDATRVGQVLSFPH